MKPGDLVVLSAYGKNLKNHHYGREEDVGLVLSTKWDGEAISIVWASDGKKESHVPRKDLKFLNKAKKNEKST